MADEERATPDDAGVAQTAPPVLVQGEAGWIMQGINPLNARIDGLDERLRAVENKISKATGWVMAGFAIVVILQILLKFFDISITPS